MALASGDLRVALFTALRRSDYSTAAIHCNGVAMFEMLPALDQIEWTELSRFEEHITKTPLPVYLPRILWAIEVVRTRKVPAPIGDLDKTGQVADARAFVAKKVHVEPVKTCTCGSLIDALYVDPVDTQFTEAEFYRGVEGFWCSTPDASTELHLNQDVACVLWGHLSLEVSWTAGKCKNYNVGNHKSASGRPFTCFSTYEDYATEKIGRATIKCSHAAERGWVNGKFRVDYYPPHKTAHFAAFNSLPEGLAGHIRLLSTPSYSGCLAAIRAHCSGTAASAKKATRMERVKALAAPYSAALRGYATGASYEATVAACAVTAVMKYEKLFGPPPAAKRPAVK